MIGLGSLHNVISVRSKPMSVFLKVSTSSTLIKLVAFCSKLNISINILNSLNSQGKWQYEVQLSSRGVMQLGWATANTKFSQDRGVGKNITLWTHIFKYN